MVSQIEHKHKHVKQRITHFKQSITDLNKMVKREERAIEVAFAKITAMVKARKEQVLQELKRTQVQKQKILRKQLQAARNTRSS